MTRSIPSWLRSPATAVLAASLLCSPALAQGGAETVTATPFIVELFTMCGFIGYIIMAVSVLAVALAIEHYVSIKRDKLAPPHLIDELEALFEDQKFQEAVEVCEAEPNYLTKVVGAGLSKLGHSYDVIRGAIDETREEEEIHLHQKIGWLSLIASVSTMLGLLGTVQGMVITFGEIASKPSVKPADLAYGIKVALITTLEGLCVAIPITTIFVYFRNKVITISMEIAAIVAELFERFREKPQGS